MSGVHRPLLQRSLVFVDPGKNACGIAHWDRGVFQSVSYTEGTRADFTLACANLEPAFMVVEVPVSYVLTKQKGDQNDLIAVALSAGACMGACSLATTVTPGEWKGQVPKEIHHKRAMRDFDKQMMTQVMAIRSVVRHNAIDAIALGLWWRSTQLQTAR